MALSVGALGLFLAAYIYHLAAPPKQARRCDFRYPATPERPELDIAFEALDTASFEVAQRGGTTNDASCLNKTHIFAIVKVRSEDDVRAALRFARQHGLKITPAGSRHSMGGQSFSQRGLVLDMKGLNAIDIDGTDKVLHVESGAIWKDIQARLDEEGLAVKAMQSINLFTVGGTLSVNAHGIAHDPGQIAPTVRSMRVMLSSGEVRRASPTENTELFGAVLGGYGLVGVILDVELDIVDNDAYVWKTDYIDYRDFPAYFDRQIVGNRDVALMYARLSISPTSYLTETAVHRYEHLAFDIEPNPLGGPAKAWAKRLLFNLSKTGAVGRWLRWQAEKHIEPGYHKCVTRDVAEENERVCIATRNQKMNQSMEYLAGRLEDTNILQEYFVPLEKTTAFVDGLRAIVRANDVNLLNVTLRVVTRDTITALPYAKDDRIAYVLYFNQRLDEADSDKLRRATVELIDLALANGGTFYLPYQLHYSPEQLRAAYPEIDDFFALKARYDPIGLFTNSFYEKYGN